MVICRVVSRLCLLRHMTAGTDKVRSRTHLFTSVGRVQGDDMHRVPSARPERKHDDRVWRAEWLRWASWAEAHSPIGRPR
jgi:hypothetical protein